MKTGLLALVLALFAFTGTARATVNVTRADDPSGAGNCPTDCSLRQAIAFAGPGETVQLGVATYSLTRGTLQLDQPLILSGVGAGASIIDGRDNVVSGTGERTMHTTSSDIAINDLTLQNGFNGNDGTSSSDPFASNGGGALFNDGGAVTLNGVWLTGNYSPSLGGAISTSGSLTLNGSEFLSNGGYFGAGIFARSGTVAVTGTSFRDGAASNGGAMYIRTATVALTNSTLVANGQSNSIGGGIVNQAGNLSLLNVTLDENQRGGIQTASAGATTSARNTIFGEGSSYNGDGSCVAAGHGGGTGWTTGAGITQDLGHNIDEDGSCELTDPSSITQPVGLGLAPLGANGGPTATFALLYGSPAIDAGSDCPAVDQRGVQSPWPVGGACDIGAYEAQRFGLPSVTTLVPTERHGRSAKLAARVNFTGEGGELGFFYGTSPTDLTDSIAFGAGRVSTDTVDSVAVEGLEPETTYFAQAYAKNASGTAIGDTISFTTTALEPDVDGVEIYGTTDTATSLSVAINPNGHATSYVVKWTSPAGSGQSQPEAVGEGNGYVSVQHEVQNLKPGVTYSFTVIATNAAGSTTSDPREVTLARQVTGAPGTTLVLTDSGDHPECPQTVTIDWGDTTAADPSATVECTPGHYVLTARHAYAAAGHYPVTITYPWDSSRLYAQITPRHTLTVSRDGTGTVTGEQIDCGTTCSASYEQGTTVTLSAAAGDGYSFDGWGGACDTARSTCTVTLDADKAVSATFSPVAGPAQTPVPPAPTPAATPTPAPPEPDFHETVVVKPVSGTVLIKLPGSKKFVVLPAGAEIPLKAEIDVTKGKITLTSVPKEGGKAETATFYGGVFTVTQVGGVTVLKLSGPQPSCKRGAKASAGKKVKSRKLWGDGKGTFRTSGKYSAATVRGTRWLVQDSCSGTLTRVASGVVSVRDTVTGKTRILRAGQHYLAKPKKRR